MAPALKKPRIEGKSGKSKTKGELMQSTHLLAILILLSQEGASCSMHCIALYESQRSCLKVLGILECNATCYGKHESFWCRLSWSKERTSSRNATTSSWTCAQAYRSWPRPNQGQFPFHHSTWLSLAYPQSKSLTVRTRLEKTDNSV